MPLNPWKKVIYSTAVETRVNNWEHMLPGRGDLMRRLYGMLTIIWSVASWPQDTSAHCCFHSNLFLQLCVLYVCVCSYCRWPTVCNDMCLRTVCERGRTRWPVLFSLTLSFPAFQRHNGEILTTASVKHLSHWRFVVSFQLDNVQRTDQDLYRCVTQSPKGSGVSNFAELVVKGKHTLLFVSYCALL